SWSTAARVLPASDVMSRLILTARIGISCSCRKASPTAFARSNRTRWCCTKCPRLTRRSWMAASCGTIRISGSTGRLRRKRRYSPTRTGNCRGCATSPPPPSTTRAHHEGSDHRGRGVHRVGLVPSAHPRYKFEKADICDAAALDRVFSAHQPDAVLHLAAESHVDRSIDAPSAFIDTNIVGTFTLLQAARRYLDGLPPARRDGFRFHHVSTDEVYGSLAAEGAFREDTPYAPNSPYSASKAASDHLVRAWQHTFGLPVIMTNCSNNYGPYQHPEKLIPLMITSAVRG